MIVVASGHSSLPALLGFCSWIVLNLLIVLAALGDLSPRSYVLSESHTCTLNELHYEYTECDSSGGRWRVAVPKIPGSCDPSSTVVPVRGTECNFACEPGEFLDIQGDQHCHKCHPGTYSLGGGSRFDDWSKLPPGFAVKVESVVPSLSWEGRSKHRGNCSRSEWSPRGSYIMSLPGRCPSNLFYSPKLVRAGQLTFEYQYSDAESIFHFSVQNDQCQAVDSENDDKWPELTGEGQWSTVTVSLKTGLNVLQWRTIGALTDSIHPTASPVLIRKIEITGVAYTPECSKCAPGTFSGQGAAYCNLCPADHFSDPGADHCQQCQVSHYSVPGSGKCLQRPPCSVFDYTQYQKPCSSNGKTHLSHRWNEPRICFDSAPGSVHLPKDGPVIDCPPCNPGMHRVNVTHCDFCNVNQFADPLGKCLNCPASTSPNYHMDFRYWNVLPPSMTSHCISSGLETCTQFAGWIPAGDHLRTSFGLSDHSIFLLLRLKVDGFPGEPGTVDGKPIVLSTITFDLEVNCSSQCQLLFMSDSLGRNGILQSWDASSPRKSYNHDILTNESITFTWVFQPDDFAFSQSDAQNQSLKMANYVKFYSVAVSKTLSGGATLCLSCPQGKTKQGCIPCPDGHYVDPQSQNCAPCPEGTVLPSSNAWGRESCQPCGPGLHPDRGRSCKSDCHFIDGAGRDYDFTQLNTLRFVAGSRLFTASGTQFYHGFNISLCSHDKQALPTCFNNVTSETSDQEIMPREKMLNQPGVLSSMICRSTLVPRSDSEKPVVSTQPVSLGTHLIKIVSNVSLQQLYESEGFFSLETEKDIHFYYESGSSSSACPKGRATIISLHCDSEEKGAGQIELPPKCSDGTCDGCTFHFLWRTVHACPTCRKEDYQVVKGECVGGEQELHYIPPDDCLLMPSQTFSPLKQKCTTLPMAVIVAIPVAVGLSIILVILLIYCWSKNKRLSYKYMKLVATSGGQDGEMPAAETCGMDDDEDDMNFSDPAAGFNFFSRIKSMFGNNRMKEDENPFVAVRMAEKEPLT